MGYLCSLKCTDLIWMELEAWCIISPNSPVVYLLTSSRGKYNLGFWNSQKALSKSWTNFSGYRHKRNEGARAFGKGNVKARFNVPKRYRHFERWNFKSNNPYRRFIRFYLSQEMKSYEYSSHLQGMHQKITWRGYLKYF